MSELYVAAARVPNLDHAEARRRLAEAYRIILEAGRRAKGQKAADRDESTDQTRTQSENPADRPEA
jgi:hypothetical protein